MADERIDELAQVHRLVVRFGNELLQDGFTSVPNLVLTHYAILGVTAAEMMFSIHIWQYWWTEKDPYPALQTIADRMSVTRRQVRNYAQGLKAKGYLVVNERADQTLGQLTSEYDFGPLLEAVLFVRMLLGKLAAFASRAQQVELARSLGRVFSQAGEHAARVVLDDVIERLRIDSPLLAHALQDEREAILAMKASRPSPPSTPGKYISAPPRKNPSEGHRKDFSSPPRKDFSSEEYIEQEDEASKNTHREKDEGSSSTDFEGFALTQHMREPFGLSKQAPSDATPRQAQRARSSGMTAIGQIVARRRSTSHQDASRRSKMPLETATEGPNEESAGSTPALPSQAQNSAPGAIQSAAGRGQRRDAPPKLPPYLEDLVTRHSEELHDPDHLPQNLGQAGRLWKQSGWSESAFGQALTEAKAITLRRDVKKRATVGGEFGARNKMPYYFKVLRDLLGMKEGSNP
jgi:DnaD N-terminal domain